jgi:hypothetical protein
MIWLARSDFVQIDFARCRTFSMFSTGVLNEEAKEMGCQTCTLLTALAPDLCSVRTVRVRV